MPGQPHLERRHFRRMVHAVHDSPLIYHFQRVDGGAGPIPYCLMVQVRSIAHLKIRTPPRTVN